jgi:hypothetical protein
MTVTPAAGRVRIALVEHIMFAEVERFLSDVFASLGYETDFIELRPDGKTIDRNVLSSQVVDVFACDLSFGVLDSFVGLDIVQSVKAKYPDIVAIGISSKHVEYSHTAGKVPSFDLFAYKVNFNDAAYKTFIANQIRTLFRKNVYVSLDRENSVFPAALRREEDQIELSRLLRAITFTSHSASAERGIVCRVALQPLPGGLSGSHTFKMLAYNASGLPCVNSVLKVTSTSARSNAGRGEVENYLNYVKWHLPFAWRPELIGWSETKAWGAVCYSFVGDNTSSYCSLNERVEAGADTDIVAVAKAIFDPDVQSWYHPKNIRQATGRLSEYYEDRLQLGEGRLEARFKEVISRSGGVVGNNSCEIDGVRYPLPDDVLRGRGMGSYSTCIQHGDLHGGNVLLGSGGQPTFIDFSNTGRGHVFNDFVTFESNIRLRFPGTKPFAEYVREETAELAHWKSVLPYALVIRTVRELAKDNFKEEPWRNYQYAMGVFAYRLLRIKSLTFEQLQRCCACILAVFAAMGFAQQSDVNTDS